MIFLLHLKSLGEILNVCKLGAIVLISQSTSDTKKQQNPMMEAYAFIFYVYVFVVD